LEQIGGKTFKNSVKNPFLPTFFRQFVPFIFLKEILYKLSIILFKKNKTDWNKLAEKPAKTPFKNRFYLRFVDNLFHYFLFNFIVYNSMIYFKLNKIISIKITNLFILFIDSIK